MLEEAPSEIRLTFNESVEPTFATVLIAVAGSEPLEAATQVEGADVVAVVPDTAADQSPSDQDTTWRVTYRVVAGDGHPVPGTVDFTVSATTQTPTTEALATARAGPARCAAFRVVPSTPCFLVHL